MRRPRSEYVYVAERLVPRSSLTGGNYRIARSRFTGKDAEGEPCFDRVFYDWDSMLWRLVKTDTLKVLSRSGNIYQQCMMAIDRLHDEELAA